MHDPHYKNRSVNNHGTQAGKHHTDNPCQIYRNVFSFPANRVIIWTISILIVLGLSPWWLNKALQIIIAQPDTGKPADAIVVLGRGPKYVEYRTAAAVKLWQAGRAPHVFISGITDAPIIFDLAQEMGIPQNKLSGEACSRSTWENAFYSKMLISDAASSKDKQRILLVTDNLHIARATIVFRSLDFEVIPYPVGIKFSMWRKHVFREFFALMYYGKVKRLTPPTSAEYKLAQKEAKSRILDWQCTQLN